MMTPSELSFFAQWLSLFDFKFFAVAVPLGLVAALVLTRWEP